MSKRLHVKYLLYLSEFNETLIFSIDARKKLKLQVSSKSVQWEPSCSTRTDGRKHMTKLIVAFRNFANARKNGKEQVAQTSSGVDSGRRDKKEANRWTRGIGDVVEENRQEEALDGQKSVVTDNRNTVPGPLTPWSRFLEILTGP